MLADCQNFHETSLTMSTIFCKETAIKEHLYSPGLFEKKIIKVTAFRATQVFFDVIFMIQPLGPMIRGASEHGSGECLIRKLDVNAVCEF